jgi:catechol 2,3-dioxygenase-like lactoylglutathione lyase family enzyme
MATFNHVGHCVRDVQRAQRFYEAVLGFTFQRRLDVPEGPASRLLRVERPVGASAVYLERAGFVLELLHFDREGNDPQRARTFTEPGLTHLSFTVADLDAACALVTEHGGEVLADTRVADLAVMIRDPDGQRLELLT